MTKVTPRRIAATIIKQDIEIVAEYWRERHDAMPDNLAGEVQEEIDKLLATMIRQVTKISDGLRMTDLHHHHAKQEPRR